MLRNRREFQRFHVFIVIEFKPLKAPLGSYFGITRNFSFEGFSFESQHYDLKPGEILEFKFKHPQSDLCVSVQGEIVWKEKANKFECLTGIKLGEMDEASKNKMLEIISAAGNIPVYSFLSGKDAESVVKKNEEEEDSAELIAKQKEDEELKDDRLQPDTIQPMYADIPAVKKDRRKKTWLYISVTGFVLGFILVIIYENFNEGLKSPIPAYTKSISSKDTDDEQPLVVADSAQAKIPMERELPEPVRQQITVEKGSKSPVEEQSTNLEQFDVISETNQDTDDELPLVVADSAQTKIPMEQELTEPDRLQTAQEKSSKLPEQEKTADIRELPAKEDTTVYIGEKSKPNPILASKEIETIINIQPIDKDLPDIDREVIMESPSEIAMSSLKSSNNIPEKAAEEIYPGIAPDIQPAPELKNKIIPEVYLLVRDKKTDYKIETRKTQQVTLPPLKEQFIFEDSFNDNDNNWDIVNTGVASVQIKNGEYIIENKRDKGAYIVLYSPELTKELDYILEASMKKIGGSENHSYGLILGAQDVRNNYVFQITENGYFSIGMYNKRIFQKLSNGEKKNIIINQNSANSLRVVKQDNNARFYINDEYIDGISNLSLYGSKVGLIVGGKSRIAVDNIRISEISAEDNHTE